ncbi:MAG: SusC/RagA family TonB-linked outer membrane protein [Chitinophagaceae bacterium]|nr:SusC/RagA family TonB-linked outer membrane protein [Chitinophagaceae bacterium]
MKVKQIAARQVVRNLALIAILLVFVLGESLAQTFKVTGRVKDAQGAALAGVAVVNSRTKAGTSTDASGVFSIEAQQNDVLNMSFVGMQSQSVKVTGADMVIDIQMQDAVSDLDAVVVTALGIKRKDKALGYAVQSVSGEGLQTVKGVDVATSLTGKVAGMLVRNSTEFSAAPDIQLRGEVPLLVVDGVPYGNMSLRDIPQDDIEDITVLRGPTASALYGYRGASGAIMVTTKRGSANKGLNVSFNSGTMFAAGHLAIPELQTSFGRVVNTATNTYVRSGDGSWGPPLDGREVIQWDPISKTMKPMPFIARGADNFANFLEQGYILNNNLNVVQQGELGSFRASATWVRNKGQYPNSMFDKMTYTIGGDMKYKKFSLSSSLTYNKNTTPNRGFSGYTGYDPMYALLIWSAPDWDLRDYKDYWLVPNEVQNSSYTAGNNNPYFDRYERTYGINRDIFNGSLTGNYDITNWLKFTARLGYDTYSERQEIIVSKGSFQGAGATTVMRNGTEVWGESQRGSYNLGQGRGYSMNGEAILSANTKYKDFVFDGFVGGSMYYNQDEGIETRTRGGLSIPGFYSLRASIDPVNVASNIFRRQVNSVFGRVGVSWKNIVFAEGTLRNDWVSTLSASTRSYSYPSVSGSFIVSELLPKTNWLSMWKLRGSWANSKTPASIYAINEVYSIINNAWSTLPSANLPTVIRGSDVRPESSSTLEFGTVVNVFKNRMSLDVTYYEKRLYDFLRSSGITPATGYSANFINTQEEITRKGVEVALNATPIRKKDFQWDLGLNWSKYARYYTKLDPQFSADRPWVKVGERADHYVYRDYLKDPEGNIIHNNGLPLYSAYDSRAGFSDPDWIWGLNTQLRYKNWQFAVSFDGRQVGLAQTTTEMYMWRSGGHPNSVTEARYKDAATPGSRNYIGNGVKVISGTVTFDTYGNITSDTRKFAPNDVPVTYKSYIEAYHKGTAWGGAPSPVDLYSTTFTKLREMSITYNIPKHIAKKIGSKGASVSAIGQNMFLWAKDFKYSDPDGGSENFADPSLRWLGMNLKFNF